LFEDCQPIVKFAFHPVIYPSLKVTAINQIISNGQFSYFTSSDSTNKDYFLGTNGET